MKKAVFGTLPSGEEVHIYTLQNAALRMRVLDYGCRIQSLFFDGRDMICGFDALEGYLADDSWQGACIGRVANRIRDARFDLNGKTYHLIPNEGNNHHHGTFGATMWEVKEADDTAITFTKKSPSEEEGYPGDLSVEVTYTLEGEALIIRYRAVCDADTPINLTNHSYFNLDGVGAGPILHHELKVYANEISVLDEVAVPTGAHAPTAGTGYDLADFKPIGAGAAFGLDGYDTNFFLTGEVGYTVGDRPLSAAASLRSASYQVDCYTDMPCIQIYTGNFLGNGPAFKYGTAQKRQHAVCLETQFEPNCVNLGENILRAGEEYDRMTVYTFRHR